VRARSVGGIPLGLLIRGLSIAVEGVAWFERHVEGISALSGDDVYLLFGNPILHGYIRWIGELFNIKTSSGRR